jgi:hypothetical protein
MHIVITNRLRRDFNEHSSKFDYDYIEFKNYFVNINANRAKLSKCCLSV